MIYLYASPEMSGDGLKERSPCKRHDLFAVFVCAFKWRETRPRYIPLPQPFPLSHERLKRHSSHNRERRLSLKFFWKARTLLLGRPTRYAGTS